MVDVLNNEVKYIDISYAIQARELHDGFRIGDKFLDSNTENPDDFFLKTEEEIAKAEGRTRQYNQTETELIEKVKMTVDAPTQ